MGCLSTKEHTRDEIITCVANHDQNQEPAKAPQDDVKDKPVWMTWADRSSISIINDMEISKIYDLDNRFGKLIHGYIMIYVKCAHLPPDVHNLIWQYLPKRLKFENFNHNRFISYEDGHRIQGLDSYHTAEEENAYQLGLETLYKEGTAKGIHYLSIDFMNHDSAIAIGIKNNKQFMNTQKAMASTTKGLSYYHLLDRQDFNSVITIKLDCDNWNVSFLRYNWSVIHVIKEQSIEPDAYHFGINARSYDDIHITIVDTKEIYT